MIARKDAEALFASIRDLLDRLETTVVEILDTEAWLAIGHQTFGSAYLAELQGLPIRSQRTRNRIAVLLAQDGDLDLEMVDASMRSMARRARYEIVAGIPPEDVRVLRIGSQPESAEEYAEHIAEFYRVERPEPKPIIDDDGKSIFRKSTFAQPPSRQMKLSAIFTEAEIDQWRLVASAHGSSLKRETEKAIRQHFARLESSLRVSV